MLQRSSTVLALAAIMCLALAPAVRAETGGKPVDFHLHKASALSSMKVYNPAGEDLGKITDLVMDEKDGRIIYAALTYGGVAGVGSKMFAVPWEALALHEKDKNQYFVLDFERTKLENATGFRTEDWPTEADRSFIKAPKPGAGKREEAARSAKEAIKGAAEEVKKAAKEAAGAKREIYRTSGIIGTRVKSADGEDLGKIYELVFDTKQGKLSYTVLAYGGVAGVGAKWFAMGWDNFKLDSANLKPGQRVYICQVDKAILDSAPGFTSDNWPHEPDKRFSKKPANK